MWKHWCTGIVSSCVTQDHHDILSAVNEDGAGRGDDVQPCANYCGQWLKRLFSYLKFEVYTMEQSLYKTRALQNLYWFRLLD